MSRLPDIAASDYTEAQQHLHESLASRPEVQQHGVVGPFAVWMHAPEIGSAMSALGAQVRFSSSLPQHVTEVAICTTGAFYRASFEFAAHRPLAVQAGVDEAKLDRLAAGEEPGFEGDEAAAHTVAVELLRDQRISRSTYADAAERFGPQGLVELVTTIGYYGLISMQLNGFEVALSPGMTDPFAD